MFEIDKAQFGAFLSAQRKEKGYTQKELAQKLFLSDKAISKWECGLSMPDISLLIPLSEILDVSVTELLEGKKLETTSSLNMVQAEELVKKALTFSEISPEQEKEQKKRRALSFAFCLLASGCLLLTLLLLGYDWSIYYTEIYNYEILAAIFGAYFWLFAKTRLPVYYDENKISAFSDGPFRMNLPGVHFNNSNWPHVVKVGRIWTGAMLILHPLFCLLSTQLFPQLLFSFPLKIILLFLILGSLFLPMIYVGRKYR